VLLKLNEPAPVRVPVNTPPLVTVNEPLLDSVPAVSVPMLNVPVLVNTPLLSEPLSVKLPAFVAVAEAKSVAIAYALVPMFR